VGWMMRNAGIFGSRRECFELGNALVRRGHQFIYFSEDGSRGDWLPNVLEWKTYADIPNTPLDILVWSDTVEVSQHHEVFFGAPAKVKSYCIMGFDPNICENRDMFSDPLTDKVIKNSWVIADSDWQLPYMSIYTDDVGVSIGGVNLNQFRPVAGLWKHDVMWSG